MSQDTDSLEAQVAELQRRNAELQRELWLKTQMYATLVEDQRELICRFSMDGTLSFVNDAYCRYFSKTREELIGHRFAPLVPEEDQVLIADVLARLGPNEPVIELEHRVLPPGGEVRWLNWIDRAILDEAGNVAAFQAVGIDVTDRRRAEEHATRNEQLRAELIDAQEQALRELSAPLIPIADDVLAMPLVGRIDEKRAQVVLETLLEGVVNMAAETVLLDVTGITTIDTQVAEALVRTAHAVKLIGAKAVFTGIQPHVAQTLITMGVEVHGVITVRSLKDGIAWAIQERGKARKAARPRPRQA
ncbi:PAS domain S-box protein [Polyangium jinanense]|uniref:PAS domain S-box protein n=1 Tax=Polyangium jinanense TaxID=2829994 RepID=A0A9X3X6U2_9BACT|nr:PAS domain S-box protein [Polyangium jinanense]MDC3955924.1 PAS domain S-box protein [Polyangium jinanense]MDC3983283.1 PAS domain S-box protein [Polyangium jinanense]MDC3985137.1 PAS domain S-box protein [Polyangium jinanense]